MSDFLHIFKFRWIFLLLGILLFPDLRAQQSVGIGTSTPNPNAILDIKSDKQGLLVPRLNSTQKSQMAQILQSSAGNDGMIVFDTDQGKFYYWFGGKWNEGLGALASSDVEGDLQGNLPSPLVVGLQGRAMSSVAPSNNQVLKWNGSAWTPASDIGVDYMAGAGIQIVNGQIINSGDLNASDDVLKTDIAGGDLSGTFNNLVVRTSAINTVKIADEAITSAKIANQNITTEKIADEAVTLDKIDAGSPNSFLSIAADGTLLWESKNGIMNSALSEGHLLIGNSAGVAQQHSVSGDLTIDAAGEATIADNSISSINIVDGGIATMDIANDAITKEKIAADLAGAGLVQEADGSLSVSPGTGLSITGDNLNLTNTGVATGAYGQNDKVAQFTVDAQGRIVSVLELDIEASPAGIAGGELNGNYPNPTIRDGVITQTKIANDAVGLPQIKNDDPNMMMITDPSGNPRWFEPFANQVIITGNDGRISSESRSAFATPSLPPGNVFVGSPGGVASPLPANSTGHILIGNGSGLSSVDISGDIDMNITGSTIIQPGVINNSKIANDAVNSAKIEDGSIAAVDLANASVTNTKIAANAVTTDKISDATITNADLNKTTIPLSGFGVAAANVDLGSQKLISVADPTNDQDAATKNYVDDQITGSTTLTEGSVYVGDNTNTASAVDGSTSGNILVGDGTTVNSVGVSGDVTLAADGTATIEEGAVNSAKILDGSISNVDLALNSVNSSNIVNESIVNQDLANDAVTTDKISDGTISNDDLNKTAIPLSGFGAAIDDVNVGGNELIDVAEPTIPSSAATKNYVDTQITGSTTLAEGSVYVGDNSNMASAVDGSTSGNILLGDGTTVNSVGVSGDVTLAADGTATIEEGAVTSAKILDGSIANSDLAANSVNSSNIVDGSIANEDLADNAVTTDKISDATITDADLNKTAIPLSGFGAAAADVDLGANELTNVGEPTQNTSAATKNYVDTQITGSTSLMEGSVYVGDNTNTASAVDGSTSGNILIGDGTTVNSVGVSGDVTLAADGTTTIEEGAVTSAKILDGTIANSDLAANSVNSSSIVDETIANEDLADNAVTTDKISDGTITDADLNKTSIPLSGFGAAAADVDLGANELTNVAEPTQNTSAATKNYVDTQITSSTSLTEGSVYIGDNTNTASAVDGSTSGNILVGDGTTVNSVGVSGDVTLAADGTATIEDGAITSTKIFDGSIANSDLAANSVNSSNIVDESIANGDLADNAVTTDKISDATITNADLNKTSIPLSGFGAAAADVDLGANELTNVAEPTQNTSAATKNYVDTQITSSTSLTEGSVYVGDNTNTASAVNGSTSGNILVGDGTTVNSVGVSGDLTLAADGTATIEDGAVTSTKILDGSIANSDLAANSVNSSNIVDESIANEDLVDNAVTTDKISDGTITNADLNKTAIPLSGFGAAAADVNLGANELTNVGEPTQNTSAATKNYVDTQITGSTSLMEGSVYVGDNTNTASAVDGSTSGNILIGDGTTVNSVGVSGDLTLAADGTATIEEGAVNSAKILDGSIANSDLAANSVNSSNIVDESIANEDLADNAVTSDKISDATITNADLNKTTISLSGFGAAAADVDLGANELTNVGEPTQNTSAATKNYVDTQITSSTSLTEGSVYVGDNTNMASAVDGSISGNILVGDGTTVNSVGVSGDVSLVADGTTTIGNNAITTVKIIDNAITSAKIADGTVGTADLVDGGTTNAKIAADAISTDKIVDGTIINADLAASSVNSSNIVDGTIANEDIADNTINFEKLTRSGANNGQVMVWDSSLSQWVPGNATSIFGFSGDITAVRTPSGSGLSGGSESGYASLSLENSGAGEVLIGDGTNVNATTITGDISLSSTGVSTINNNTIDNANISDGAVNTAKIVDGAITAQKLDQMAATSGDVIKWNGTSWAPAVDNVNDLDFDPTNEIQNLSISGNTISLTGSASINISTSSPTENQVLTYKSGAWKAENPTVAGTITRTGFYSVDPLDFQGVGKDGAQKIYYHGSSPAAAFVATDETSGIAAPIHLPHGATVTSVSFYFYDSDGGPGRNMNFLLQRKARASGTSQNMGTYQTSGGPGAGNTTVSTISNEIIDNSLFTYRVVVEMDKDGYDSSMRHRVYSVIVEYTEVF